MTTDIQNGFIQPQWDAPTHIRAFTTLKQSHIGIPQATIDMKNPVAGNVDRQLLKQTLQLPSEPVWVTQIHSTTALNAIPDNREKRADATYSHQPNQVCAVLTADCLPVLLCNRQGTQVAAIHAGWRGLVNGIIEETLKSFNSPPEDIIAWLGPAIGPTQFEVRKDVYQAFVEKDPEASTGFRLFEDDHWLADIYTLARLRLQKQGINQVTGGNYCTFSDSEKFYSYRRDKGLKGFIVSLIWIAN